MTEKPGSIIEYPTSPCRIFHYEQSWYYTEPSPDKNRASRTMKPEDQVWVCAVCHPPVQDPALLLKGRILKGNFMLNKLNNKLRGMSLEERGELQEVFTKNIILMRALIREFKNYTTDCLYIQGGKKMKSCLDGPFECFGCPNEYWPEKELMNLGRKPKKEK